MCLFWLCHIAIDVGDQLKICYKISYTFADADYVCLLSKKMFLSDVLCAVFVLLSCYHTQKPLAAHKTQKQVL